MFRRVVCVTNAPVPQGRLRDQRNVAQKPWGGPPSCDPAPLTTSLRGLWVSGNAGTGQWWNVRRGGDPKNRPSDTKGRRPKNRPAKGGTLEATWVRGEGTREPWRRGATDFLQVVAATACATVTSSKPTPLGMGCLWSASGTGLLGSGTGLFLLVLIVCGFAGTVTRFLAVRLLALPVLRKRPWPLVAHCIHPLYGTACAVGLT